MIITITNGNNDSNNISLEANQVRHKIRCLDLKGPQKVGSIIRPGFSMDFWREAGFEKIIRCRRLVP